MEDKPDDKAKEPAVAYTNKKTITFFKSFEEMEEHNYRVSASLSYEKRMANLEELRKHIFYKSLLPDGTWPLLSRRFTIIHLPYDVCK